MDKRLIQIIKIMEIELGAKEEDYVVSDEKDWQCVNYLWLVEFYIENDKLCVCFYSNTIPATAGIIIQSLNRHKVKDFDVYENMYPKFKNGEFETMLFGEEADEEYLKAIIAERKNSNIMDITGRIKSN